MALLATGVWLVSSLGAGFFGVRAGTAGALCARPAHAGAAQGFALRPSAVARVERGLVVITTSLGYAFQYGEGTGMVISPDGVVLTCTHVVDGAVGIAARSLVTGQVYGASVLGYDRTRDVAVLRLKGAHGLPTVPLGASADLTSGAALVVLGRAHGSGDAAVVSRGTLDGIGSVVLSDARCGVHTERLTALTLTGAHISGGDSGGPVLDGAGRVVGMIAGNRPESGRSGGRVTGFAVPVEAALAVAGQVAAGRATDEVHIGPTASLGVAVATSRAPAGEAVRRAPLCGAVVAGVVSGSPADVAGVAAGDVLVAVTGWRLSSGADLTEVMARLHPGEVVHLVWKDGTGREHSSLLCLAAGPPE